MGLTPMAKMSTIMPEFNGTTQVMMLANAISIIHGNVSMSWNADLSAPGMDICAAKYGNVVVGNSMAPAVSVCFGVIHRITC